MSTTTIGRGATVFNRGSGDPDNRWPNPSLAPLEKAPFYAVKLVPGSFGTFAVWSPTSTHTYWVPTTPRRPGCTRSVWTSPASWVGTTRRAASISARR
jgi:hypothetical protein